MTIVAAKATSENYSGVGMTDISHRAHRLFARSSHEEIPERYDGIAPMAFCCIWIQPDGTRIDLNGYGGEKSPSVMLALGLAIGVEAALLRDPDLRPECVMEKLNFWDVQEANLMKQLRNGRTSPDGQSVYKNLIASQAIADVQPRLPNSDDERALIDEAREIASRVAKEAYLDWQQSPEKYQEAGLHVIRDSLPPFEEG